MGAFMQLLPDPFSKKKAGWEAGLEAPVFSSSNKQTLPTFWHVRRPIRGTQFKGETFATLEIKSKTGHNLLLFDSGSNAEVSGIGYSTRYSNFLLQNVQESRAERNQIMETFGPSYIWFFGERPTVLSFSGVVLNSADFNWKNEFLKNYDLYFRGTQCVDIAARAYISYDDVVKQGYILSVDVGMNAEQPELCDLRFQMIVSAHFDLSSVGNTAFPEYEPINPEDELIVDGTQVPQNNNSKYSKIYDNEDEYIARKPSKPVTGNPGPPNSKKLEDMVKLYFVDNGMKPPDNLENLGGSGVSVKQIMGWVGNGIFTSVNLVKESKVDLPPKDKAAADRIDDAKKTGLAGRLTRLI